MEDIKYYEVTYLNSIYSITNPFTNQIFYVGKTQDLSHRKKVHCSNKTGNKKLYIEFYEIKKRGGLPIFSILDFCKNSEVYIFESYWISQLRAWGFILHNIKKADSCSYPDTFLQPLCLKH